ncbi:hypothetical protein U9M48_044790 [Paspalum notatum var. saurae]|uniref:non-specific serine/threonine protein kinase n=1 Tax=Paspalum notatum var. saurae TaxID=547442 RepID=A0AAQ3XJV1_PASNO
MAALLAVARLLLLLAAAAAAFPRGARAVPDGTYYNASKCHPPVACGGSVVIRYPFFLADAASMVAVVGDTAYSYCGYPGMAVACEDGRATLRLKDSNYTVLAIDYANHNLTVADADVLDRPGDGCPRVTHNVTVPTDTWLNLSATADDDLVFFFDCVFTEGLPPPPPPPPLLPINCSSFQEQDGAMSFVAVEADLPPSDQWPWACKEVFLAPVLKDMVLGARNDYYEHLNSDGYGELLKQGFQLSWDPSRGPCFLCEKSSGQCSYNQSGEFIGCLCSDGHPYQCGSLLLDIAYPFSVAGVDRPDYCSFPGYLFSCTDAGKLVISTNSTTSRVLQVTSVDYDDQLLTVIDQSLADQSCLEPYRNTTIDDAMFAYTDCDQFLTVYVNCSAQSSSLPLVVDVFSCLSGGRSYYTTDNGTIAPDLLGSCTSTLVLPCNSSVASSLAAGNSSLGVGDAIRGGFTVQWKAGAEWCGDCRNSGGLCGYNSSSPSDHAYAKMSKKKAIVIGTSTAAGVLFLLLVVMTYLYIRKRRQYKMTSSSRLLKHTASEEKPRSRCSTDMESGSVHSLQTHHFTYEELEEATDSFSGAMEIGDGGFGTVYKGHLRDGRVVAVKRLYNNSYRRVEQFVNEAAILSRLRHPNLVLFYGCTSSRSRELLLVYELVPNGTVADHLHGHRAAARALTWPLRLNIAVEAAAALAYLHAVEPPIVHRDVKTNNILLDADFHVKVADFGLSRLFPLDATHVSTAPQGTPGYVDPEYHQCYQLTDRSDVYSFGVVLVELISSKPAVDVTRDRSEINLAGMAINKIQRCQLDKLVDLELGYGSDAATTKATTMVAELAFRCLQQNGEMRPPIKEVLDALRSIQEDDGDGDGDGVGKKKDALIAPTSPDTVHAPWDSMSSTTPSTISQ